MLITHHPSPVTQMISRKTLAVLALAAAAAVGMAVWLSSERAAPAPASLFPGLAAQLGNVAGIRLTARQGQVTLARQDGEWVVREKADFPASAAKLRDALQGVAGLSAPEARTRDPLLYERVGLDPEQGEKPTRLELLDGGGRPLADLWIGRTKALPTDVQRNEYFVRRGDEAQVWRVEGRLPAEASPQAWIEKRILHLDRARLRAVTVAPRAGPGYRVSRDSADKPEFAFEGLGADEKIESPLRVNSLVSALQNLGIEEVLQPEAAAGLQEHGRVSAETFDGLVVELQLFTANGKRCARLSAGGSGSEALAAEIARLNGRWRGRTFQLADYQADILFAARDALVQRAGAEGKGGATPKPPPAAPSPPPR